jgi:nucleotide-binding universal stress UspA family protein
MIREPRGPVVVGTDGSVEAGRAADYGMWEAQRRGVALRLVLAHQPTPMWGPAMFINDDYEWESLGVRQLLADAEKAIAARHQEVPVQAVVVPGSPAAALVDESKHASLVVLGTRATGGLIGHLSGSVAAQVAAHSHAPVVVLRPDGTGADPASDTGPVVLGLDGSAEAERAIKFAVDEAIARGVELQAVYAWSVLEVHGIGPIAPAEYDTAEEETKALRLLTEATEGWSELYPELKITRRVIHSLDPTAALVEAGDGASLIVVGSRGHGGFLGLRLGSTVDGLVRFATAPVAVVRGVPTVRD